MYATDDVLALLMCAPRSAASWDIVVSREGDRVFLDKREGGVFGACPLLRRPDCLPETLPLTLSLAPRPPARRLHLGQRELVGPAGRDIRDRAVQHGRSARARGVVRQRQLCGPGRARGRGVRQEEGPARARPGQPVLRPRRGRRPARQLWLPLPQVRHLDVDGRDARLGPRPDRGRRRHQAREGLGRGGPARQRQDAAQRPARLGRPARRRLAEEARRQPRRRRRHGDEEQLCQARPLGAPVDPRRRRPHQDGVRRSPSRPPFASRARADPPPFPRALAATSPARRPRTRRGTSSSAPSRTSPRSLRAR